MALVSLFHNLKVFQLKFHSLFSTCPSLVEVFHILFQMFCLLFLYLFYSMIHFLRHYYSPVNCNWIGYFHQLAAFKKFHKQLYKPVWTFIFPIMKMPYSFKFKLTYNFSVSNLPKNWKWCQNLYSIDIFKGKRSKIIKDLLILSRVANNNLKIEGFSASYLDFEAFWSWGLYVLISFRHSEDKGARIFDV